MNNQPIPFDIPEGVGLNGSEAPKLEINMETTDLLPEILAWANSSDGLIAYKKFCEENERPTPQPQELGEELPDKTWVEIFTEGYLGHEVRGGDMIWIMTTFDREKLENAEKAMKTRVSAAIEQAKAKDGVREAAKALLFEIGLDRGFPKEVGRNILDKADALKDVLYDEKEGK